MRTVYIDEDNRCHVADDGTMTAAETTFFGGKCDYFVEGFCMKPSGEGWEIYPWKPIDQLQAAQTQYETMNRELENAYREGVNSL